MQPQRGDTRRERLVAQREHAAFARGEVLVGVEAEAGDVADGADLAPVGEPGLGGVRGILHQPQAVLRADVLECGQVARMPGVVHGHDCPCARRDCGGDGGRIEAERVGVDVAEDRPGACTHDHIGRRGPGQRRRDDLVVLPLADAERAQREVHGGRAGGDGERHRGLGIEQRTRSRAAARTGRSSASRSRATAARWRAPPRPGPEVRSRGDARRARPGRRRSRGDRAGRPRRTG